MNKYQRVVNLTYLINISKGGVDEYNERAKDKLYGNAIRRGMTCLTCVSGQRLENGLIKCEFDEEHPNLDDFTCEYWEVGE